MDTFETIITKFPKDFDVLDVGCGGIDGENTSTYLARHFKKVTGITISQHKGQEWQSGHPNYEVLIDNFYDRRWDRQFDLLVLDLTIESNILNDWSDKGLKRAAERLRNGGYLINYVMMTDEYGDPEVTKDLIHWHTNKFWGGALSDEAVRHKLSKYNDFDIHFMGREKRRPEVLWVCLKKK